MQYGQVFPKCIIFLVNKPHLLSNSGCWYDTPKMYGKWRHSIRYNPYLDIRKNFFVHRNSVLPKLHIYHSHYGYMCHIGNMCPVILILLTGTLTVEYVHGDLFTDDGMLIHQDGPVWTIAGIWNVLVTIEPPGPPQFDSWANELQQVITSNWTTTMITDNDKLLWMARIDDILANVDIDNEDRNDAIRLTNELTRMKRGLMRTLLKLTQFMGRATRQPSPTNGTNSSLASCISTWGRRRHRRGLLNAVGHLGKSLIGVATTMTYRR